MILKRPERIKIISKRFTIEWVDPGTGGIPEESMGICDTYHQKIMVENDLKYDTEKETLFHEVLHAISDEMGLEFTEAHVAGAARGILAVLMDNPSFARFLLKKETKEKKKDGTQKVQD